MKKNVKAYINAHAIEREILKQNGKMFSLEFKTAAGIIKRIVGRVGVKVEQTINHTRGTNLSIWDTRAKELVPVSVYDVLRIKVSGVQYEVL